MRRSGYAILKERMEQMQRTIEAQQTTISRLTAQLYDADQRNIQDLLAHRRAEEEMLRHMGWLRRWFWYLDHKISE